MQACMPTRTTYNRHKFWARVWPSQKKDLSIHRYCCWRVKGWERVLTTLVMSMYIQCHARQTLLSAPWLYFPSCKCKTEYIIYPLFKSRHTYMT